MLKFDELRVSPIFDIYFIKFALRGISPKAWHRLRVFGEIPIATLYYIVQRCMGWGNDQLYSVHSYGKDYGIADECVWWSGFFVVPRIICPDDIGLDIGGHFA